MDRFNNVRNYLNSVNRGVLLAVGLVVIAGLIAAVFVYGDANDVADDNGAQVTEENGDNGETRDDEVEVRDTEDENGNGEEGATEDETVAVGPTGEEPLPGELADTGPAAPLLAIGLLGGSAYLYRRSKKGVEETNRSV